MNRWTAPRGTTIREDSAGEFYLASEVDARIAELKVELVEEARLNGMGSEREARQLARISELEKRLEFLSQCECGALLSRYCPACEE